ncbi:hypothetical protein [Streptomyces sp. SID3343]|uniref:hypothetical protein n=1 Tax=Streptomyces sp. SID3343 TaxID=2690260 RepID=UPI00137213CF|nr:hypothetical protein [Streptomyces sp. SID3343]MYW04183.1 hypothetical protein [Streptomyces sp. SID3343]
MPASVLLTRPAILDTLPASCPDCRGALVTVDLDGSINGLPGAEVPCGCVFVLDPADCRCAGTGRIDTYYPDGEYAWTVDCGEHNAAWRLAGRPSSGRLAGGAA